MAKTESKIAVHLRDTRNGYASIYHTEGYFEDGRFTDYFWWSGGNNRCDCNRSTLLYEGDKSKELPCDCGGNIIVIDKIVRIDTGEILYSEIEEEENITDEEKQRVRTIKEKEYRDKYK